MSLPEPKFSESGDGMKVVIYRTTQATQATQDTTQATRSTTQTTQWATRFGEKYLPDSLNEIVRQLGS